MQNVSIATSVTEILAANVNRSGQTILIQNQSDTNILLAYGDENIALLTASLGQILEPGDAAVVSGATVMKRIAGIHGGSGSKTAHWQRV
jgi:hypothetical protein